MNKREKILIVLSSLALLYAVFNFFIFPLFTSDSSDEQGGTRTTSNTAEIAEIDRHLLSAQLMVKEKKKIDSLIGLIEMDWNKDPFKAAKAPDENSLTLENGSFIYSGFIQIGSRYLAVINGMEYSPGEIVQESRYTVGRISPDKITLNRNGKQALTLYLKED